MTVGKTASELEAMIMEKLRHRPACVALYRVGVIPAGEDGGWDAEIESKMGMSVLHECARAKIAVVDELRREYHLLLKRAQLTDD
jgi:hypothetical protein